jgi:putative membrane protein
MLLWIKAFHIIFMVTWFAGLFYLPRLFVYHAMAEDEVSKERFKIMERKLFFGIMTPGALLTLIFGIWMIILAPSTYLPMKWLHIKLGLVFLLLFYHIYLGKIWRDFKYNRNSHSHIYYRWINEVPVVFLISIVILAVVKPIF